MKNVSSTLFSNLDAVQNRVAAIERRLERLNGASGQDQTSPVGKPSPKPATGIAEVQPFFPKNLAVALKKIEGPRDSSGQPAGQYDDIITSAAEKHGVDADLVKAVIKAESGFRSGAVSPTGAVGLMQLMPSTASSLGASDPLDPAQNIEAGTKYLKSQIDRFGDTQLALAAYNAGPGNVVKYGGIPPFNETKSYVSRVMGYLGDIKNSK